MIRLKIKLIDKPNIYINKYSEIKIGHDFVIYKSYRYKIISITFVKKYYENIDTDYVCVYSYEQKKEILYTPVNHFINLLNNKSIIYEN